MTSETSDLKYWANTPTADFTQEAFKRMTPFSGPTSTDTTGGTYQNVLLAAQQAFYGAIPLNWTNGPSSSAVGRDGDQGNQVTLKVNNLRSHALAQHQIVTAPPLSWQAQAVNSDSRSMASALRGSKILEYEWKNSGLAERTLEQVLGAIIFGEEFLFSPWSSVAGEQVGFDGERVIYAGDIVDHNVASWDLMRDGTARSYDGSDWYAARVYVNKWNLIAEHPDRKDEILAVVAGAPAGLGFISGPLLQPANSDRIPAYYFFHKQTPALPSGRQAVLLNNNLCLSDGPLEPCYREVLPIHRMAAGELKGTPFPYTSLWEALAIQELADDIQGSLATNIVTFGKQLVYAIKGTNLAPDQVADGPNIIYGNKGDPKPEPIQLTASPPEAFQHLERLRQDIRQTFGLNDIVMGQPDTAQMNAQAFALIASMAIQQNSDLQKRHLFNVTSIGRSRLRIFRVKASRPRKVSIVGKHGPLNAIQEQYTGEDFSSLDDVFVTIAAPLLQTPAGRLQVATLYKDQGFVQTPEQLQTVVETGELESLTQGLQAELLYIAEENEQLLEGKQVLAKITDSHQMHIREHRAPTFSAQARSNPEVNRVSDEHIKSHLEFLLNTDPRILAAMGQAAPMPAMPPPGAPPGEGGAPPPGDPSAAMQGPLASQPSPQDVPPPEPPNNPMTGESFTPPGA